MHDHTGSFLGCHFQQIDDNLLFEEINGLLIRKKSGIELGEEKRIEIINSFIESNINKFETSVTEYDPGNKPNSEYLDKVFFNIVK